MLFSDRIRPHTTFYEHIGQYGVVYFMAAFPLMLLMDDAYFNWVHRLMHTRALFGWIHLVHQRLTSPSPWTAYTFHPLEAAIESLIFVIFLFTQPVHTILLTLFFFMSLVYNVYGHLGFELYPRGFNRHWRVKWMDTQYALSVIAYLLLGIMTYISLSGTGSWGK